MRLEIFLHYRKIYKEIKESEAKSTEANIILKEVRNSLSKLDNHADALWHINYFVSTNEKRRSDMIGLKNKEKEFTKSIIESFDSKKDLKDSVTINDDGGANWMFKLDRDYNQVSVIQMV